jgi:hypothetical protein
MNTNHNRSYITGSGANSTLKKIDSKKRMFTLVFSCHSPLALDILPKEGTVNSYYFCNVVFQEARRAVWPITEKTEIEETMIHVENCKAHTCQKTIEKLKSFRSEDCPISHIPPTFRLATSDFSAGATTRCVVKGSTVQRVFESSSWIYGAISIQAC